MSLDVTESAWVTEHLGAHAIIMAARAFEVEGKKLQEARCELPTHGAVLIYFDVTIASARQRLESLAERKSSSKSDRNNRANSEGRVTQQPSHNPG